MNKVKDSYPDGSCPDCFETIPDDVVEGDDCVNCGHVFTEEQQPQPILCLDLSSIKIEILEEEVTITCDDLEVVHWIKDEWIEDPEVVVPAIANAIHLAHTKPALLVYLNRQHILSQVESV
jgi:hypothetical protein